MLENIISSTSILTPSKIRAAYSFTSWPTNRGYPYAPFIVSFLIEEIDSSIPELRTIPSPQDASPLKPISLHQVLAVSSGAACQLNCTVPPVVAPHLLSPIHIAPSTINAEPAAIDIEAPAFMINLAPGGTVTFPTKVCEFLQVSMPLITLFPSLPLVSFTAETTGTNEIAIAIELINIRKTRKKLRDAEEYDMPNAVSEKLSI